ncbi:MAG: hypothetical protein Q8P67_03285 [archaeon]|nr:hypothetical protein [archaeon]
MGGSSPEPPHGFTKLSGHLGHVRRKNSLEQQLDRSLRDDIRHLRSDQSILKCTHKLKIISHA